MIKSAKSAGYAGGKADEPQQELLIVAELADRGQQLVEIERLLRNKTRIVITQISMLIFRSAQFFNYLLVSITACTTIAKLQQKSR